VSAALIRRLILFRHAKSAWLPGVQDHDRSVDERGERAAPLMGRYIAEQGLAPDLALVSSARRAQETWSLAEPAFATPVPKRDEARIYDASVDTLLALVRATGPEVRTLLMVGHNPGFEDLGDLLAGSGDPVALSRLRSKVPTASLIVIDIEVGAWSEFAAGRGRLERFVTPKSLGAGEDD